MAGASLALLPFLLSFVSHLACRATASSSTGSAQLLFKILNATQAYGDPLDGWDAATLVKSVEPSWKPGTVGSKEGDFIPSLPGQPRDSATVKQYGGYVDIGDGEKLFYYFVESFSRDAHSLPVLLWINGGPGCSSVGSGAFLQHGPFSVNDDGKTLRANPDAWASVANIIYLDTPVNVGLSYSDDKDTALYDDTKTTLGCLKFVLGWLERFPEYRANPLYLAGDGYAGIVLPRLAELILEHNNRAGAKDAVVNIKKLILGNPTIDAESELWGVIDFQWIHGLVSKKTRQEVWSKCKASSIRSDVCRAEIRKLPLNDQGSGPIYPYDLRAAVCNPDPRPGLKVVENYYECVESHVAKYLSQKEVQRALHGNSFRMSDKWIQCNKDVDSKYQLSKSSLAIIRRLASNGFESFIYSGDSDAVVPMMGTRYALQVFQLDSVSDWTPWFYDPATLGGYTEVYNNTVIFATMRGAGHSPTSRYPERALNLFIRMSRS
ncbi:unnamed protein product [Spirodela intermedia]|uniref:Uncharacterized protein n=1 Tax=Spirodela intermedia TaxID=51605 RepID=A0A7I8K6D4_SPIIN|nr:unnamed protein product [Spirodela intermedia]